jgi:hypothetical protein
MPILVITPGRQFGALLVLSVNMAAMTNTRQGMATCPLSDAHNSNVVGIIQAIACIQHHKSMHVHSRCIHKGD